MVCWKGESFDSGRRSVNQDDPPDRGPNQRTSDPATPVAGAGVEDPLQRRSGPPGKPTADAPRRHRLGQVFELLVGQIAGDDDEGDVQIPGELAGEP